MPLTIPFCTSDSCSSSMSSACLRSVSLGTEARNSVGSKSLRGNSTTFCDLIHLLLTNWNLFKCTIWRHKYFYYMIFRKEQIKSTRMGGNLQIWSFLVAGWRSLHVEQKYFSSSLSCSSLVKASRQCVNPIGSECFCRVAATLSCSKYT